jgi:hypothetical protein
MWLFLVLLWCSSVAGRGERLSIVRDNSQFSRLIRGEIPCLPLWEFIGNVLILPAVLAVKRGSMARIDENSRFVLISQRAENYFAISILYRSLLFR